MTRGKGYYRALRDPADSSRGRDATLVQVEHPVQAVIARRVQHAPEDPLRLAQKHLAREEQKVDAGDVGAYPDQAR